MSVWKVALGVFLGLVIYSLVSSAAALLVMASFLDEVKQVFDLRPGLKTSLSASAPTAPGWLSAPVRSAPVQHWIPGRPLAECMKPGKVIDNDVLRCRSGHYE